MKTAIYVLVSTDRQTQAQTIEQQMERLRNHLELQGEALPADNIFRDDGFSGANLNRPGLDRLRDRVKGGVLDRGSCAAHQSRPTSAQLRSSDGAGGRMGMLRL